MGSRWLGEEIGISPMKIDYFVRNFFGGVGRQFLDATNLVLNDIVNIPDKRIQLLTEQLSSIQDTVPVDKVWGAREDFLSQLSAEDKEAVLRLERSPEKRVPVISDILRRIYHEQGGQLYRNAAQQAKKALEAQGTTVQTPEADEVLVSNATQNTMALLSGKISIQQWQDAASRYWAIHTGRRDESWRMREMAGAIAGADVQDYLPEAYRWRPEQKALSGYHQLESQLIANAKGELTEEKWDEIHNSLNEYLNNLLPEISSFVQGHLNDRIEVLPDSVREIENLIYFAKQGLDEYYNLEKPREQINYRREHPTIDAKLFILGRISKLRSTEAEQLVDKVLGKYNIDLDKWIGKKPTTAPRMGLLR